MSVRRLRSWSWSAIGVALSLLVAAGGADARGSAVGRACGAGFLHQVVRGHVCRPAADLHVAVSAAPSATRVGGTTTYSVTVANRGRARAERVAARLTGGLDAVSVSTSRGSCVGPTSALAVDCALGTLAPGARALVTIEARAGAEGTVTLSARVTSPTRDSRPRDNAAAVSTRVTPPDSVRGTATRPLFGGRTPGLVLVEIDAIGAPLGGEPAGTFSTRYGPAWELRGTVVCVTVAGNRASVGGVVEYSTEPAYPVGSGVLFAFTDNGPGLDTQTSYLNQPDPRKCPVPLFAVDHETPIDGGDFVVVDVTP